MAAPSLTPPRPCLRGFQATQSSRASGHKGMAVYATVGGPVRATSLTRTLRGWTAPALRWAARRCAGPHRLGNALDQALRLASPHRPPRGTAVSTGSAARCPCHDCLSLPVPLVRRFRQSLRSWRSAAVPLLPASVSLRAFLLPCTASQCHARGLLRQGETPSGGGATPGTGARRGPRRVGHGSQDVDATADGVRCAPWTAQQVPLWQVLA